MKPHIRRIEAIDPTTTVIDCECPMCHTIQNIQAPTNAVNRWLDGTVIQNALPFLTIDEREALVSGTCHTCWDRYGDPATYTPTEDAHIDQSRE